MPPRIGSDKIADASRHAGFAVVIDHAEGSSRHPTAGNCRIPRRSGKLRRIPFSLRILVLASEKRENFEKSTSPPPSHLSSRIRRERGSVRGQRGANLNEGGGVWSWSQSRDGFGCVASFVIVARKVRSCGFTTKSRKRCDSVAREAFVRIRASQRGRSRSMT